MEIFREEINFQSEININKLFLKADCHRINLYVSVEKKKITRIISYFQWTI